jgi:hypothetical protein
MRVRVRVSTERGEPSRKTPAGIINYVKEYAET